MKQLGKLCFGIGIGCLGVALIGCNDTPIGTDFADKNYAPEGALVIPSNVQVGFFDLGDPDNSSIAFDLTAKGESISSTELMISFNGEGEVDFSTVSALPATLNVTMNDVLAALSKTADDVAVGDAVRFSFRVTTQSGVFRSSRTLRVPFSCVSNLKGEVDYVSTVYFCTGDALAGTAEIIELGAGRYSFSDWSFGTYPECYGGSAASWGTLTLNDVCNKLSVTGTDNYGDSWQFTVNSISGTELNASWSNTYGEFGSVTLTKTDGTNWPPLTN